MARRSLLDKWLLLDAIMIDNSLPASAKAAAYHLLSHFNLTTARCYPSYDRIAERMGVSRSTSLRAVQALLDSGYFTVAGNRRGGRRLTNSYTPNWSRGTPEASTETVSDTLPYNEAQRVSSLHRKGVKSAQKGCHPCTERVSSVTPEKGKENGKEIGKEKDIISEAFEEWWPLVPRKVGKKKARQLYGGVLNSGEATIEDLRDGILRYAAAMVNTEARYIAHPSSWLSQGRWADDPAAYQSQARGGRSGGVVEAAHKLAREMVEDAALDDLHKQEH